MTTMKSINTIVSTGIAAFSLGLVVATTIPVVSADLTYADYLDVQSLFLGNNGAFARSTCPNEGNNLRNHWDFDGDDDCVHFPRQRGDEPLVMRLVRLAFHDSTGYVDRFVENNPFHDGLEGAFLLVDQAYHQALEDESISSEIGIADFYAFSYLVAVERAVARSNNDHQINWGTISYGRKAASETDGPLIEDRFPDGRDHADGQQLFDYFSNLLGFSERETGVLIGAHTLGRARRDVSGFVGPWNNNDEEFDNNYYSNLLDPNCDNDGGRGGGRRLQNGGGFWFILQRILELIGAFIEAGGGGGGGGGGNDLQNGDCVGWEQVNEGSNAFPRFQWRHSCRENGGGCRDLMLNLDMGLLRDIDDFIDPASGAIMGVPPGSGCSWPGRAVAACFPIRESGASDAVIEFSSNQNEDEFIDEFSTVFLAMVNNVADPSSLSSFPVE